MLDLLGNSGFSHYGSLVPSHSISWLQLVNVLQGLYDVLNSLLGILFMGHRQTVKSQI